MSLVVASATVSLARAQFATTSLYHFLFVPLTLGLGPLVAIMQTLWHRTNDERWLRLQHFFGTLCLGDESAREAGQELHPQPES